MEIRITEEKSALSQQASELFASSAIDAVEKRGHFAVALAGGSTPKATYHLLTSEPYATSLPWEQIHLFWGDERCVPPDDGESNYLMVKQSLLDSINIPSANIHRMAGELEPHIAANKYALELKHFFSGSIRFDLVMLGMGDDGHTASLFPHTDALHTQEAVAANYVPKLDTWRLTLSAQTINAARHIVFLVAGEDKAPALHEVLQGEPNPEQYPSQLISPDEGNLTWLVDKTAASQLRNI